MSLFILKAESLFRPRLFGVLRLHIHAPTLQERRLLFPQRPCQMVHALNIVLYYITFC